MATLQKYVHRLRPTWLVILPGGDKLHVAADSKERAFEIARKYSHPGLSVDEVRRVDDQLW
jgi:hypothetical protein